MAENGVKETLYDKLVKGGTKGFFAGSFLALLGYVVGVIADSYVPGVSGALGAGIGFLAGLGIGLGDAF